MFKSLLEILSPDFVLRNSLYSSVLIGAVVPMAGIYLVVGRRTILALMLPQVSTAGVALMLWAGSSLGLSLVSEHHSETFLFLALTGAIIAMAGALSFQFLIDRVLQTPSDSESGAVYALAAALTLAIAASNVVPELGLLDVLRGEILAVPTRLLLWQVAGFTLVVVLLLSMRHSLNFVLFDRVLSFTAGLPANTLSGITTGVIALTIALGGLCAGPLTIFAFLVLPSLTVLPLVRHMRGMYIGSAIIGVVSAFGGFWLSYSIQEWTLPIPAAQIGLLSIFWLISRGLSLQFRSRSASSQMK
jgi:zinc transport system permease protein